MTLIGNPPLCESPAEKARGRYSNTDGAGYHTSGDLSVPSNISLIQLPPYSPELNPGENLWHYLRAHHWSNRPYRDYDELQEEAVRSLCKVCEDPETIKTVCNAPYIRKSA